MRVKIILIAALMLVPALSLWPQRAAAQQSEADIRAALIRESIARYPGRCPCPYNINRAGRRCASSSAYSKPGGHAPLCYPKDVSDTMVAAYRRRNSR